MKKILSEILLKRSLRYKLTEPVESLYNGRLVVGHCLYRGDVLLEEVDPVSLQDTIGPGRLPPRHLNTGGRH